MLHPPQTLEEARAYRYHVWGGNPKGHPYREGYCAYECYSNDRTMTFYQCSRKMGKGVAGLYCGTHAKKVQPKKP